MGGAVLGPRIRRCSLVDRAMPSPQEGRPTTSGVVVGRHRRRSAPPPRPRGPEWWIVRWSSLFSSAGDRNPLLEVVICATCRGCAPRAFRVLGGDPRDGAAQFERAMP
jgi:hypothetical protein